MHQGGQAGDAGIGNHYGWGCHPQLSGNIAGAVGQGYIGLVYILDIPFDGGEHKARRRGRCVYSGALHGGAGRLHRYFFEGNRPRQEGAKIGFRKAGMQSKGCFSFSYGLKYAGGGIAQGRYHSRSDNPYSYHSLDAVLRVALASNSSPLRTSTSQREILSTS